MTRNIFNKIYVYIYIYIYLFSVLHNKQNFLIQHFFKFKNIFVNLIIIIYIMCNIYNV